MSPTDKDVTLLPAHFCSLSRRLSSWLLPHLNWALLPALQSHGAKHCLQLVPATSHTTPSLFELSSGPGTLQGNAHEPARTGISCQVLGGCCWQAACLSGCLPRARLCLAASLRVPSRGFWKGG